MGLANFHPSLTPKIKKRRPEGRLHNYPRLRLEVVRGADLEADQVIGWLKSEGPAHAATKGN